MAKKPKVRIIPGLKPLQKFSLFFFDKPRTTALILLLVVTVGIASYATLLKREGFPPIATPLAVANGSYLVNDPAKVDNDVAKPLNNFLVDQNEVKSVQSQSFSNFYQTVIYYKSDVNATVESNKLSTQIQSKNILPEQATFALKPLEIGFTYRGDEMVISYFSVDNKASTEEVVSQAKKVAGQLDAKNLPLVESISIINPYETAKDPITGQIVQNQTSYDRYGNRQDNKNKFFTSVVIGVQAKPGADNLELYDQVNNELKEINKSTEDQGFKGEISASSAPQIREQIKTLQTSLLEGLLAVLVIGSLVIAIRASIITVLSMLTVIAAVNALMYLIGYSLNTITLFALILSLSLIVDDTIIMVEAIDSQRRKQKDPRKAVEVATGKVSRAMIAATSTAALSFAPLIFVGGILGSFIRVMPITIISALVISLFVALMFIPLFSRYLLLGKKQMGEENVREIAAGFEARIAKFISGPMLWAKGSTKKLVLVGSTAVIIGLSFIGTGGFLMQKVGFNIFPAGKDTDQISVTITMPNGTDINKAQEITDEVDKIVGDTIGENFTQGSYYGQATIQSAAMYVDLTSYRSREITAPQIIDKLKVEFANYKQAEVEAGTVDAGPPAGGLVVQVNANEDREAAMELASAITSYLENDAVLKRPDGTQAKIKKVSIGNTSIYTRKGTDAFVTVNVKFEDTDTTTLVTLTKDSINKQFTDEKISTYGLKSGAITFDAGQEEENQDSFKTLALAFPVLLLVIYFLLSFQFKSLLQPILIFTALPFSLFGITLGLYLTDNPFSFFAMLGFFALIGLSIKNTILLTDYANQSRKAGMGTVDSAHEALAERFRPLIATSLTAVVSLIPLTLSSPFWEGLGVVLIFGLLSSTFLVITVFPYYYLGAEFLRQHVNRRTGIAWLLLTIVLAIVLSKASPALLLIAPLISILLIKGTKKLVKS